MKNIVLVLATALVAGLLILAVPNRSDLPDVGSCIKRALGGLLPIAEERNQRFLGKVDSANARCRGGENAVAYMGTPWVDWANYWATSDGSSRSPIDYGILDRLLGPNRRGLNGALMDLEYQRLELIQFNLFDNYTFQTYVTGRDLTPGRSVSVWDEMRLPADHANYEEVGGAAVQECWNELVRYRTVTGICNDIQNPLMGATGTLFARNVQFEETFPRLGREALTHDRHDDRINLMTPDPQVVSRRLLQRPQIDEARCNDGYPNPDYEGDGYCDYTKAPFFNVLAAFWIQFMTHDWFSHLVEGRNTPVMTTMGCREERVNNVEQPLTPERVQELGCRRMDSMEAPFYADTTPPGTFTANGQTYLERAHRTTANNVTAWWDASQIYGYDARSRQRVKRDPQDPAKLFMVNRRDGPGRGERQGYLPIFEEGDPFQPEWAGQPSVAFPDNWSMGLAFLHTVFAREHNLFVEQFRQQPLDADSGLRDPANPDQVITYGDASDDLLFEVARLVVAAEIAKIHTIEWTPQLLYDEALYDAMNANWSGLFGDNPLASKAMRKLFERLDDQRGRREDKATSWWSIFGSGSGILGLEADARDWRLDPDSKNIINRGVNHFGSPFNFPEEFVTVYRLHPLVPDFIEYREWQGDPNVIRGTIPVVETFRGKATPIMTERGLANMGLSLGRQRLGALSLNNHPRFLQNLVMRRLDTPTQTIDVAALDILRDRQRGIPRFNEFRRQYGLKHITDFDDFIDRRLPEDSEGFRAQAELAATLEEVYGTHVCDASKIITASQLNADGTQINDCLGFSDGTRVDNVEDLDMVVGFNAETTRPHGYAISGTQFVVFIINASRRLFSDRFFTSSFRPEFYSSLGYDWVMDNGPGEVKEAGMPNGHEEEVTAFKRILLRTMPELEPELRHVVNAFDPWARDRGEYYSLEWKPRPGAEADPAFRNR